MKKILAAMFVFLSIAVGDTAFADPLPSTAGNAPQTMTEKTMTETIVLIRHGEKTATELGQLSSQGLNRALALPDVLIGKYGKPDYLFAPNPSAQIAAQDGNSYSYVRPLATIEPTAIRLGMPVNTQIGFGNIKGLQEELTKPKYAGSIIFVAWEHLAEDEFARNVMVAYSKGTFAKDPPGAKDSGVPRWPGKDFDSIFVIHLVHSGATTTATFRVDHEGLDEKLSSKSPVAAGL